MGQERHEEAASGTEKIVEYRIGNAIVRVHVPILSEEEYECRRKEAEKGLERLYRSLVSQGVDWDNLCGDKNAFLPKK